MLPTFPKARKAMGDTFNKELFRAIWDVSPILKEIRTRPQTEGRNASYEQGSGKVVQVDYQCRSVERRWKFEDATGLSPEEFLKVAADIGKEMGNKMLRDILSGVGEAAQEVGNVVDCQGNGLTFDKFLEMITNTHTEFDDLGRPDVKTFVGSPEACQNYEEKIEQWTSDPAKRAVIDQIMEKHRQSFYEREARRRMVD